MDMSTTTYNQIFSNLSSGHFQIDHNSGNPYIGVKGGKKVVCIINGKIEIERATLNNITNAQNTYGTYQTCHQRLQSRTVAIATTCSKPSLPRQPGATVQVNPPMWYHSPQASQRASHEQSYQSQPTLNTELTKSQLEWLHEAFKSGAYFNDEVKAITPLHGVGCYVPNQNGGFTYSAVQNPLNGYQTIKKQCDTWSQKKNAQTFQHNKPSNKANGTSYSRLVAANHNPSTAVPPLTAAQLTYQLPNPDQTHSSYSWSNTHSQQRTEPAQARQTSYKTTQIDDVVMPAPPSVTNADEARRQLQKEFDKQSRSIDTLKIEERYEPKKRTPRTGESTPKTGARKEEFKKDLDLQLRNANQKIDQCHTTDEINKTFRDQWLWMNRLGIYRHWCLRQAAPDNPLPYYPGRVSIQNTGTSCGPDASIIQLLHSGTMNYFIFRPQHEETERNAINDNKNNIDHQTEWQRLYREILFGSKIGGQIMVPNWIRDEFDGMWNYSQVNSYAGSFFAPEIVWTPKEPLKRIATPGANTEQKLRDRILGDWRACRLHTTHWHYTTLIKDKNGEITSIDMGSPGKRTFKNSQELLDLFLAGKHPYNDPSLISFWE